MRNAVTHMINGIGISKTSKSRAYIGCSPDFLRNHLEKQFRLGMTWDNHGEVWEVDHIIPLSAWDFKNHPEHIFKASHYSNLQPLFRGENLTKKDRCIGVAS